MTQEQNLRDKIEILYSNRKTISIEIQSSLRIVVRAPKRIRKSELNGFIDSRMGWLEQHYRKMQERTEQQKDAAPAAKLQLEHPLEWYQKQAAMTIAQRAAFYAPRMQVTYGRIAIRNQKTRWGSCSSLGNLNFNWKLILLPPELLDYVVVHELAHRKEMNHSPAFWEVVEQEMPDYRERRAQLKKARIKTEYD